MNGKITAGGTIMLVVSLCLGALVGEWINIERRTEQLGEWLKAKTGSKILATFLAPIMTPAALSNLSLVGSVMITPLVLRRQIPLLFVFLPQRLLPEQVLCLPGHH
ncbi:MAG: DUF554 family protein [Lachnospiraceae bacterium]|nr:DUF554 family protein [Lachnospiraceae bacterium]